MFILKQNLVPVVQVVPAFSRSDTLLIGRKNKLVNDPERAWEEPVIFHSRTKQTLPPQQCKVQDELNRLHEYAIENEMKIYIKKSKVML